MIKTQSTAAEAVGIELRSLSAVFQHRVKGEVYAVRDINLAIRPGELLTLLGPSGCGKTTTLRMVAGFQRPHSGRIFVGDRDVTQVAANDRNIGFVFQNYALFPHLSVYENIAYGLRVKRQPEAAIGVAVRDVLALVGLQGYERQMPHQLSGGEQQRVAVARAIVIKPRVLLFDEPLSNLDAKLRVQMRAEIRHLQKTLGITTAYVTHDQEEAMAISDRIAVMDRGTIAQLGSAEDLYCRPASAFVAQFIGRANLIAATIREVAGGEVTLEIAGKSLRLRTASRGLAPGKAVQAVMRPEAIELADEGHPNGIEARVLSRTYIGEKAEYVVQVGPLAMQVVRFNPVAAERFVEGGKASVVLPTTNVQLLTEDVR